MLLKLKTRRFTNIRNFIITYDISDIMDKYQHIRTFISAVLEYTKHPSETTASILQRNLGVIIYYFIVFNTLKMNSDYNLT